MYPGPGLGTLSRPTLGAWTLGPLYHGPRDTSKSTQAGRTHPLGPRSALRGPPSPGSRLGLRPLLGISVSCFPRA